MRKVISAGALQKIDEFICYLRIYELSPKDAYRTNTIFTGDLVLKKTGMSPFLEVVGGTILYNGESMKEIRLHAETQLEILNFKIEETMKKRVQFNQGEWSKKCGQIGTRLVTKNGSEVHILANNVKVESGIYMSGYIVESASRTIKPPIWDHKGQTTITYPSNIYDLYIETEETYSFEPFQKVLVRDSKDENWRCTFFSHLENGVYYCGNRYWKNCIPYNEETKHLVGTCESPDKE